MSTTFLDYNTINTLHIDSQQVAIKQGLNLFGDLSIRAITEKLKKPIEWGYYPAKNILKKLFPPSQTDFEKQIHRFQKLALNSIESNLDSFAQGMDIEIVEVGIQLSIKQISRKDFTAFKALYDAIESDNTPLKIPKDEPLRSKTLTALKKLMERPSGRALILSVTGSRYPIYLQNDKRSECYFDKGENAFYVSLNLEEEFFLPVKTKEDKWTIQSIPNYLTIAHELIHVLHDLNYLTLPSADYHLVKSLKMTPSYDLHYHDLEELYTIQGLPGTETLCENMLRYEFDQPARFGHDGSSYPAFTLEDKEKIHEKNQKGISRIQNAAFIGAIDEVKILLDHGANPNDGLIGACRAGDLPIMKICLSHGANLTAKDDKKRTLCELSSSRGLTSVLGLIHETDPELFAKEVKGSFLMHIAAQKKQLETLTWLWEKFPEEIHQKDNKGATPLDYAVGSGNPEIISFLLKKGATLSEKTLDQFFSLDFSNPDIKTRKIYSLLLPALSNFSEDRFHEVFLKAVRKGIVSVVNWLIQTGKIDLSRVAAKSGFQPIHTAAMFKQAKIIPVLVENGASINAKNAEGDTALHLAAKFNTVDVIQQLLKNHADSTILNGKGETPLQIAERLGKQEALDALKT